MCACLAGPVDAPLQYTGFKFAAAQPYDHDNVHLVTNLDQVSDGKLLIRCYNTVATDKKPNAQTAGAAAINTEHHKQRLPDCKKKFLAPSLMTEAGAVRTGATGWNTIVYDPVSMASCTPISWV